MVGAFQQGLHAGNIQVTYLLLSESFISPFSSNPSGVLQSKYPTLKGHFIEQILNNFAGKSPVPGFFSSGH